MSTQWTPDDQTAWREAWADVERAAPAERVAAVKRFEALDCRRDAAVEASAARRVCVAFADGSQEVIIAASLGQAHRIAEQRFGDERGGVVSRAWA